MREKTLKQRAFCGIMRQKRGKTTRPGLNTMYQPHSFKGASNENT
jgi:hypothetical protein